jgi:hypothetical protein
MRSRGSPLCRRLRRQPPCRLLVRTVSLRKLLAAGSETQWQSLVQPATEALFVIKHRTLTHPILELSNAIITPIGVGTPRRFTEFSPRALKPAEFVGRNGVVLIIPAKETASPLAHEPNLSPSAQVCCLSQSSAAPDRARHFGAASATQAIRSQRHNRAYQTAIGPSK